MSQSCWQRGFQYHKKPGTDAALRERLKGMAGERRRFGYRRLGILLRREGFVVNHKKLFRLYREEGLVELPRFRGQLIAWHLSSLLMAPLEV